MRINRLAPLAGNFLLTAWLISGLAMPVFAGASRSFNGTTDHLDCGSAAIVDNLTTLTVAAWVKPSNLAGDEFNVIAKGGPGVWQMAVGDLFAGDINSFWLYRSYSGTDKLRTASANSVSTTSWYWIAATSAETGTAATDIHLYAGSPLAETGYNRSQNATGALDGTSTNNLVIGARHAGGTSYDIPFAGKIAYVHVYSRVLSTSELSQLKGAPGSITNGLVGYWPLTGSGSQETDASGNGNTCTVTAATESADGPPLDITPPTGSISINGGAATTNSATVTLTLSASDNSGIVSQMQFSNDGTTYSPVDPYAITKSSWTLTSGDGTKTVYAKFSDPAGNWSTPVTATIVLNTSGGGGSRDFNGTTAHLDCGSAAVVDSLTTLTVAAWVKPSSLAGDEFNVISKRGSGVWQLAVGDLFAGDLNSLWLYRSYSGTDKIRTASANAVSTGAWYWLAATSAETGTAATDIHLYLANASGTVSETSYNRAQNATGSLDSTAANNLVIGARDNAAGGYDIPFAGKIARVHLYNRVLSVSELNQLKGAPGSITNGLLGYWPLTGSGSQELDVSGNGNNCAVTAATESTDGPPLDVTTAVPVISPPGGVVSGSAQVTLTSSTQGAQIRYTTDGTTPTKLSTLYSALFSVSSGITVKARAFKTGNSDSATAIASFASTPGSLSLISPASGLVIEKDAVVYLQSAGGDPTKTPYEYQFLVDGQVKQAWSSSAPTTWTPAISDLGLRTLGFQIRNTAQSYNPPPATRDAFVLRTPAEQPEVQ